MSPTPNAQHPTPNTVIAIDPGRAKCGIAVVNRAGSALHRAIVSTPDLPAALRELVERFRPDTILMGDGTGASKLFDAVAALDLPASLVRVDERYTSEKARARYIAETPARGWRRLLPRALRTPETPYDDYVALILAERWWAARRGEDV